jgi:hypothetical protein
VQVRDADEIVLIELTRKNKGWISRGDSFEQRFRTNFEYQPISRRYCRGPALEPQDVIDNWISHDWKQHRLLYIDYAVEGGKLRREQAIP